MFYFFQHFVCLSICWKIISVKKGKKKRVRNALQKDYLEHWWSSPTCLLLLPIMLCLHQFELFKISLKIDFSYSWRALFPSWHSLYIREEFFLNKQSVWCSWKIFLWWFMNLILTYYWFYSLKASHSSFFHLLFLFYFANNNNKIGSVAVFVVDVDVFIEEWRAKKIDKNKWVIEYQNKIDT